MAIFNYLTKDSEGKRKEGEIRADSLDTAIQKLSANGQMVISLKEVDDTFDFLGPFIDEIQLSIEKAKNRIPLSNIVFFTRQLATMFSAGLTLERAIQSNERLVSILESKSHLDLPATPRSNSRILLIEDSKKPVS